MPEDSFLEAGAISADETEKRHRFYIEQGPEAIS